VVVPEVEELREGEPDGVVRSNAFLKARAGLSQVGESAEEVVVLGVDTDVCLDGRLLGKAADEAGARERLEALSGRTHEVLSGVALVAPESRERVGVARSYVTFSELTEDVIDLYLRSSEWRDRAGAYAIQGLGAILVEQLQGDFSNVVGLPVTLLLQLAPELKPGTKTL
jgi:septum formation protein